MIIDTHAHITGPTEIWEHFRDVAGMAPGVPATPIELTDQQIETSLQDHLAAVGALGTNLQIVCGRPWGVPVYLRRESTVMHITQQLNDMYAHCARLHPDRFVCMAILPQVVDVNPRSCIEELERCVEELGCIGVRIICEPSGDMSRSPRLSDEWWYPLYEKMVELDLPALLHGGPFILSRQPELGYFPSDVSAGAWALLRTPRVFKDFPKLKIIVGHGGGYVPYQFGRARALRATQQAQDPSLESFDDSLSRLYFDSNLYDRRALELLLKQVGIDHCLFGTDKPANGDVIDPETGRPMNDIKSYLDKITWLSDADRHAIFEGNARRLFTRLNVPVQA